MYGAGDCESTSATMSCMYNVLGYTTRYITGGNHAWFEVKVPSSITKSGKDEWMMVNDGTTILIYPSSNPILYTLFSTHQTHQYITKRKPSVNKGLEHFW